MRRSTGKILAGILWIIGVNTLPVAVAIVELTSQEPLISTVTAGLIGCAPCFWIAWRFYFSPGIRVEGDFLIVRQAYQTFWIPWSKITTTDWHRIGSTSSLRIQLNGPAGEALYPRAFSGLYWGEERRMRLLDEISSSRRSDLTEPGGVVRQEASTYTLEICCAVAFLFCSIASILGS